ncbi:hypothetical protein BpHYR1_019890 [Brachionus plicatilis]|uniref:Uncharacterized protein n=1 Tax=Brachionus plicatilis TaxID=10195 RepID=A0A3M7TA69_BRAPC|nr:hypothetical protein BpHYR1_019890 [Brachionus plicatilis]
MIVRNNLCTLELIEFQIIFSSVLIEVPQVINTSFGFKIFSFSKNLKTNIVEEIELSLLYRNRWGFVDILS